MFKEITLKELKFNPLEAVGTHWLLSAGSQNDFNAMTANWGAFGYLWNKPVVFAFIRPTRHTFDFVDEGDMFTMSFFGDKYSQALKICGEKSGKTADKIAEAKLTPVSTRAGNPAYKEADFVLECRKMYSQDIAPEGFADKSALAMWYADGVFHRMFAGEIVRVLKKL